MQTRKLMVNSTVVAGAILLGGAMSVMAVDADGDGIDDAFDACCDTPAGVAVDAMGRPLGDIDLDCDTDLADYELFRRGFAGPVSQPSDRICNPVAQTGCDPCERCTFVTDPENSDQWRTFCRPQGSVPIGETCVRNEATALDDCMAGAFCANGVCAEICSSAPNSCPSGENCNQIPDLVDTPGVGYCQPPMRSDVRRNRLSGW